MPKFYLSFILLLLPAFVSAQQFGGTARVVDGDTLDVGGIRVRLHGLDAPELGQICTAPDGTGWDCGAWVAGKVRARISGHRVTCDTVDRDRYGRTVARCGIAGQDLARQLVRDGLALAYRKYSMAYAPEEAAARRAGHGLHAHRMTRPEDHRRAQVSSRTGPANAGCAIKGNIGRTGTRIYHLPGQAFYARTSIRVAAGERWFCTEAEARAAGWRRARR
ncbi:thermonuclease family protein [Roseovarius sp. D22-M7]|uniref:thermonuclease family protein n=1 Tax=Roseovarius sp. D22-M7 TaxID=3127116 RepID=UPI00300FB700